jgi:hypothetical protein
MFSMLYQFMMFSANVWSASDSVSTQHRRKLSLITSIRRNTTYFRWYFAFNALMVHLYRMYGPNKKRSCSSVIVSLLQSDRNVQLLITVKWTVADICQEHVNYLSGPGHRLMWTSAICQGAEFSLRF